MHITTRQIVFAVLAGAAGAALGQSHILCPSGQCAITGSWYGTGAIGAVLGFIYAESLPIGVRPGGYRDDDDPPSGGTIADEVAAPATDEHPR
jgi:hypothetical protein